MSKNIVPTIAELAPELAELQTMRLALGIEAAALRAEHFDLAVQEPQPEPQDTQAVRVAALLGKPAPPGHQSSLGRLREISLRLSDIDAALAILDGQIQAEKARASAKVRELLNPEHRSRWRRVCETLIAAHNANLHLRDLVKDIEDRGLSSGDMNQVFPFRLDSPQDQSGWVAQYLNEAQRAGIIRRNELPAEFVP